MKSLEEIAIGNAIEENLLKKMQLEIPVGAQNL